MQKEKSFFLITLCNPSSISSLLALPSPWRGVGGEALLQPSFHLLPVYNVPTCSDMVGTSVLEVKVVGMFPHVKSVERCKAVTQRIAAVCLLGNDEFAVSLLRKPGLTRTKQRRCCLSKLCFEIVEVAKCVVDSIQNSAFRQVVMAWSTELFKVECVV